MGDDRRPRLSSGGLSIGQLALRFRLPEYRLRQLAN
jgi:hypothetical protein